MLFEYIQVSRMTESMPAPMTTHSMHGAQLEISHRYMAGNIYSQDKQKWTEYIPLGLFTWTVTFHVLYLKLSNWTCICCVAKIMSGIDNYIRDVSHNLGVSRREQFTANISLWTVMTLTSQLSSSCPLWRPSAEGKRRSQSGLAARLRGAPSSHPR